MILLIFGTFLFGASNVYNIYGPGAADASAYTTSITTSGTVSVDVSSTGNGANLGTDSVVVSSTCPLGYTLSIGGPSDSNLYKGGDSTSDYSIDASSGTTANPLPIVGDNYTNTWGYTTASSPTINSNFIGLSNTTNTIATKSSASASGGDTVSVHYGVSADKSLEAGRYTMANSGAVTYYLIQNPNCSMVNVAYDGNNATAGSMGTLAHNNVAENSSIDLYPSNYSKNGYGFAGWSTEQINPDASNAATLISTAAANGNIYGPMATITADANFLSHATVSGNNLVVTLYAVWVKPVNNATLQGWTGCPSMNQGDVIALKDQRDNNVYAVAKLKDDNCWMIENLRLDNTNSDNSTGALAQGYGTSTTYGNFSGLATSESTNFSNSTTANSLYYSGTQSGTASINIGTTDYPGYRMPRYSNGNTSSRASSPTGSDGAIYSYGNYYTWAAAMANTGYYNINITTTDANGYYPSEAAGTSLCPKGWKLPYGRSTGKGATSGGFSELDIELGGTGATSSSSTTPTGEVMSKAWRSFPNNFLYSGYFNGSSADYRGSYGNYWSSTAANSNGSYSLGLGSIFVYPGTSNDYKHYGQSVRCLAITDYTVHFDANGGSGTMSDQTISAGAATALSTNTFTPPNAAAIFDGWNTAADGSGTSYTDGESVTNLTTVGQTITLYAQWKTYLYNAVSVQSKGKQTNDTNTTTGIKTNPTAPTSSVTVSPNSGVYEYDSSVFGADTDGTKSDSTKATIYYYRGILDSYGNTNTNGSAGLSDAYPNYVILSANGTKSTSDTCWRIIRTTGSGGVKMIYNGLWTGSTCANATTAAMISSPVATSTFDGAASNTTTSRQIVRVGYTYNNTYANTNTTSSVAFDTVMGGNTAFSVNSTDSTIKGNVETWFNNTLSDFDDANMFEANAGYCNDRLGYTSGTASTLTTSIRPYTTSTTTGATYNSYFAGYQRNLSTTQSPSLGCSSARSTVDVYSTDTSKGGNGQLGAPVGLLTADEASFAGSGSNTASQGSGYSANSYLKNGSAFWTMTPYYRYSRYAYNIAMNTNGYLGSSRIDTANGIRPVVSLVEGTAIDSGTGIATDPWVIKGPKTMQSATSADCGQEMVDTRDGNTYTTATIGSLCWMTENLDLPGGTTLSSADTNVPNDYSTTTTGFTNGNTLPASSTTGFSSNTTAYVYNSGSTTCSSSSPCYSYYSWLAATAGYDASSDSVSYDICPKGWRLPTQAELTTLKNTYTTGSTLTAAPFLGVYAGYYNNSQFNNGGSRGLYWSSTANYSNYAYRLDFNSSSANVGSYNKSSGYSIRCVLNNTTPTPSTYTVSYRGPSYYDASLSLNSELIQAFIEPMPDNRYHVGSFSANNGDILTIGNPPGNLYIDNILTYTFTSSQPTYDITVTSNISVRIQEDGNVYVTTS